MTVKDLASEIREEAEAEVKRKNLVRVIYFLTSKSNPYALKDLVARTYRATIEVHFQGEKVFYYEFGKLKRYICHEDNWTDTLIGEFNRLKGEEKQRAIDARRQKLEDEAAKKNFVICHQ